MSKFKRYLTLLAIVPLLGFMAVSCAPTVPPTGTVEVHVTDPGHSSNVTSINITASAAEIHKAGSEQEQEQNQSEEQQIGEGEWISLNITNSSFDLISLREGGLEQLLAEGNVTAGHYTQIRLTIEKVEVTLNGETKNATVPSGELKFVRPFDVVEGQTIILTLDFDADQSVTVTGNGEVLVRPVATLNVTMPSE
jgi:hypothetical protein